MWIKQFIRYSWSPYKRFQDDNQELKSGMCSGELSKYFQKEEVNGIAAAWGSVKTIVIRQPRMSKARLDLDLLGKAVPELMLEHPELSVLNHVDRSGDTPLMVALQVDQLTCALMLLRAPGVNLDIVDGQGRSLEELARPGHLVPRSGSIGRAKGSGQGPRAPDRGNQGIRYRIHETPSL